MSIGRNPSIPSISIGVPEESTPSPLSSSIPMLAVQQTSEFPRSLDCSTDVGDINTISGLVGMATGTVMGLTLSGFALNDAAIIIGSAAAALSASGLTNLVLRGLSRYSVSTPRQQEDSVQFSDYSLERAVSPIDIPILLPRLPSYEEALESSPASLGSRSSPPSTPPSYNDAMIQASQEEQENSPSSTTC